MRALLHTSDGCLLAVRRDIVEETEERAERCMIKEVDRSELEPGIGGSCYNVRMHGYLSRN
jgi:hypothetical protein